MAPCLLKYKKRQKDKGEHWPDMGGIVRGSLIFALLNLLAYHRADALGYEIESGQTKCISEEIKMNSMSIGKYSVVGLTSEDQRITVRVYMSS